MNDDFLTRFRKSPKREFAETLYARISSEKKMSFFSLPTSSVRRVIWAAATVCLVLAVTFVLSPDVRAQTDEIIRKIGQMVFTDTMPRPINTPVATAAWTTTQQGMSLAEAKSELPFAIKIPNWAPEDYSLIDQVTVASWTAPKECKCNDYWQVTMIWWKPLPPGNPFPKGGLPNRITLKITPFAVEYKISTDLKTLEELTINGKPTALLGIWGAAPADPRNFNLSKGLMWNEDNRTYELIAYGGVTTEDLIRMAETIP